MPRLMWSLTALVLFATAPVLPGYFQLPREGGKREPLMKRKLAAAHKLLEGITMHDFDLVRRNAEALGEISREIGWRIHPTPTFDRHSDEFRRTTEELAAQAKKKNVDGMALAYVDMTLACVRCHKHVRDIGKAQANPRLPAAAVVCGDDTGGARK